MYIDHVNQRIFSILEESADAVQDAAQHFDWKRFYNSLTDAGNGFEQYAKSLNTVQQYGGAVKDNHEALLKNIKATADNSGQIKKLGENLNNTEKTVNSQNFKSNVGMLAGVAGLGLGGASYLKQKRLENQLRG